ncbi:type IV pilus assembly protein PilQ [Mucilaginibacter sp. UYP25]|uniref:type II secretion system protein GspD n=1 Tax=unclassified Mucilaginibacter TaxID=2617802 RepID=UPI003392C397
MNKLFTRLFAAFMFLLISLNAAGQQDHVRSVESSLQQLLATVPGLNQKMQLTLSGISLPQYLSALSRAANLSISCDPQLNFPVNDTFNGVTAKEVLTFLARKYNLDITVIGTILYVTPYHDPALLAGPPVKELRINYTRFDNTLSLELNNDSLQAVAKKITLLSGKNVVVTAGMQQIIVTAFISSAPFDAAIEKLAFTNNIKVVKTNDGFYLFQPLEENEEVYVNGDKGTSTRKNFKSANQQGGSGSRSGLYSRLVNGQKLLSADAVNASIADLVKQASQEANKNYSIYSELKGSITLHVSDVSYDSFLSLLLKSTDYTFHPENGIYLIGDRKLEGLRTFKMIHLEHRSIDTVASMIPNDWKRGVEIKEFRDQNSILLSGSGAQIDEIEALIHKMDVLVPVVLVEVTMIDIRKSRTLSTGISAGVSDSVKTGGSVLPGLDYTFGSRSINDFLSRISGSTSLNLGRVVPNFYVRLRALEASDNINIRSVPKLASMNGHPALLSIGKKAYYRNTTQNVIPSLNNPSSIFTNVYQEVNADLAIAVNAIVSGDDQVTLKIKVNLSDFTSIPTDGSPPPQAISKFETSLRVHNEDTIVLGGIERSESSESGSGWPILSRIPILKWVFSSRSKSTAKVTTVLFIKSTILR